MAIINSDNCFDSSEFCVWWDAMHKAQENCGIYDNGVMLDLCIEKYHEGVIPTVASTELDHDYEVWGAESAMGIPSWA